MLVHDYRKSAIDRKGIVVPQKKNIKPEHGMGICGMA